MWMILLCGVVSACASPRYLVNKDDCPEEAGTKFLICKKIEKIK